MFCVFLQNIPPEQYSTISVTHNETVYTLSKELSLQNSELISDQAKNETNNPINLDYDHEYDDFQLISDLFNYKRVFITKLNIDFLEYSANYLKIPILIKKTIKFRNHYQDFLNNPIFEEIKSLHKQIFSICQQKNAYDEKDDFSDSDEENEDTQDEITSTSISHLFTEQNLNRIAKYNSQFSKLLQEDEIKTIINQVRQDTYIQPQAFISQIQTNFECNFNRRCPIYIFFFRQRRRRGRKK